jgi:hypothetical protein
MADLTKQQTRAMCAFEFDDEPSDASVWELGVRPWPTMENLVAKGLIERGPWWDKEHGYLYRLTDSGRTFLGASR